MIKEYALNSALTESEIKDIVRGARSERQADRMIERWANEVGFARKERTLCESQRDTSRMISAVKNLAANSFLTESQLIHIIDRNEHLDYADINESVLADLVRRELDGFIVNESYDDEYEDEYDEDYDDEVNESRRSRDDLNYYEILEAYNRKIEEAGLNESDEGDYDEIYEAYDRRLDESDESNESDEYHEILEAYNRKLEEAGLSESDDDDEDDFEDDDDFDIDDEFESDDDFEDDEEVSESSKDYSYEEILEAYNRKMGLNENNKPTGDVNTIIFGQDDRIEIPVGYTHIAVDFDGSVNAYTDKPILGEEGWEGNGVTRVGRVSWDDYKLTSGSNDENVLRNAKRAKMVSSLANIHDGFNLEDQFTRSDSFTHWSSDYNYSPVVEATLFNAPKTNRFLSVPSHML